MLIFTVNETWRGVGGGGGDKTVLKYKTKNRNKLDKSRIDFYLICIFFFVIESTVTPPPPPYLFITIGCLINYSTLQKVVLCCIQNITYKVVSHLHCCNQPSGKHSKYRSFQFTKFLSV